MNTEWLKQLEQVNRQIATIAHIKRLAEDAITRGHRLWEEYHPEGWPLGSRLGIEGSRVKPYGAKWWVTVCCNKSKEGSVISQWTEVVLVQCMTDGWAAEYCPVMA